MASTLCNYCGSPVPPIVDTEGVCSCANCFQYFNTCAMCQLGSLCEFSTNPSPTPKVVLQTSRQGPMTIQTQVKNPQRIEEFCHKCSCWNTNENYCNKECGVCGKYDEIRVSRPENI